MHPSMQLSELLVRYAQQSGEMPVVGMRATLQESRSELASHSHTRGQLMLIIRGNVIGYAKQAMWVLAPGQALWIPPLVPHRIRASAHSQICYVFVNDALSMLPNQCALLNIRPLTRELMLDMAELPVHYDLDSPQARKAQVLLEELAVTPISRGEIPVSEDWRIQKLADALQQPDQLRVPLKDWSTQLALSERSLARLVKQETGLTFGLWRQRFQLVQALPLLASGKSVHYTAQSVGYQSVNAFITMFKKALGLTPAQYQRRLWLPPNPDPL